MNRRWLEGQLFSVFSVNFYHIFYGNYYIVLISVIFVYICSKFKTFSSNFHPFKVRPQLFEKDTDSFSYIHLSVLIGFSLSPFSLSLSWHWYTRIRCAYSDSCGYKHIFYGVRNCMLWRLCLILFITSYRNLKGWFWD